MGRSDLQQPLRPYLLKGFVWQEQERIEERHEIQMNYSCIIGSLLNKDKLIHDKL